MKLYGLHDLRNIIIPSKELLQWQNLEKIIISDKSPIEEIFEAFEGNNGLSKLPVLEFPKLREVELFKLDLKHIRWTVLKFPNLTRLSIDNCDCLEYVFTSSMVGNLMQLQELHIVHCSNVEVIVKEVEVQDPTRVNEVEFRCLKSLELLDLQSMKGFCLGRQDFQWPSLDTLDIKYCPKIVVFTNGNSTTPKLKTIDTKYESIDAMENPNFFIMTLTQEPTATLLVRSVAVQSLEQAGLLSNYLIISFDITSEEFREVNLPDSLSHNQSYHNLSMSKLRESLVVLEEVVEANNPVFGVWMMEDGVPSSFTKLFNVNTRYVPVKGFRKSGKPIIVEDLGINEIEPSSKVYHYMETLLLLDQPDYIIYVKGKHYIAKWRANKRRLLRHTSKTMIYSIATPPFPQVLLSSLVTRKP
ncbi:hypothetical protein L1987_65257 [Smallanthus sonchifolius]|uniref:Uncharacterized protein n=1 Tax=Smallanthus sonchifolius TaxID=185202 RepID=A0ACB9BU68_9ASTR|nr:hypothetical protein L1987_65257 [Smallanthus sonchifolius]